MKAGYCTFCDIIAKRLPSKIWYEDEEIIVFENQLNWVPVQMLFVPKQHLTQSELWQNGALLARLGELAVKFGDEQCPNGFRTVSNFGSDAMQSQPHGHIHVLGGTHLGLYLRRPAHE